MPRRRGGYTLTKSTSFAIFPATNSSDKAYYLAKNDVDGQGTYKAKICLNVTITPDDYINPINDTTCDDDDDDDNSTSINQSFKQQQQQQQQSIQQKEAIINHYRRELFQFFSRDFSRNNRRRCCRTTSYDSSFRNILKYSFEKIKLQTTNDKYAKQEFISTGQDTMMTMQRNGLSGKDCSSGKSSWRKSQKVHRSKSDAFVNSQEWTLCRGVAELKLGLVGSLHSGKTSLVHRYLTGAYTNEESPEGGRFKKEVVLDGQSYLLLIRDEGSAPPDYQFAQWVDAIIFVFSLESQESIETALHYYEQMAKYRNVNEIPVMMVATQDSVTESNPRVISEHEGRQMAKNLPKCSAYYETCSTYGLNVDRVFKDACQKILQQRLRLLSGFSNSARTVVSTTTTTTTTTVTTTTTTAAATTSLSTFHSNNLNDHRNSNYNYQDLTFSNGYNSKAVSSSSYHHQRSVSAVPLQEHLQQQQQQQQQYQSGSSSTGYHGNNFHYSSNNASQLPSNYAYHKRENSALNAGIRGNGTERSMSAFVMPSMSTSTHLSKIQLQRNTQYNYNNSNSSSNNTAGYSILPSMQTISNNCSSDGVPHFQSSPRASIMNSGETDQALFVKDELFDNQISLQPSSLATTSSTHLLTPSSTPTTQRRNRRISNLFQRPKDHGHDDKSHRSAAEINMGMGRAIPVKQGHLYKRSSKTLNKEWKKKYVCLHSNGRLSYHQTLKDYMEKDASGKEVFLGLATVRIAGRQRPRNTQRIQTQVIPGCNRDCQTVRDAGCKKELTDSNIVGHTIGTASTSDTNVSTGQDNKAFTDEQCTNGEGTSGGSDDQQQNVQHLAVNTSSFIVTTPVASTPSVSKKKKSHRRLGSAAKNDEDDDCEFEIITCDQKRWEFSATSVEERDEWVAAIEELIEKSLQAQMSQKQQDSSRAHGNKAEVQALRQILGNDSCADCGAPKPDWASLNLGTLICIECSGIHRNLGSHISKVRSLDLDDWPIEYLSVMEAIGNKKANAVWEHSAPSGRKPQAGSSREEKEKWIKVKYEGKRFLPPIATDEPLGRQLLNAVFNNDLDTLLPILPLCSTSDLRTTVNTTDRRTALHIACSNASAACTQLLVWYNADLRVLDEMGRSALWHAQTSGALDCAAILLKAGLDPKHGIPDGPEMITGSLSSREFCYTNDKLLTNDAKLQRQSDVVVRRIVPGQQLTGTPSSINGFHRRNSDAFERLPASVI
ncbi:Centaurin-gamma-1A [Dirofilaria immitis]